MKFVLLTAAPHPSNAIAEPRTIHIAVGAIALIVPGQAQGSPTELQLINGQSVMVCECDGVIIDRIDHATQLH